MNEKSEQLKPIKKKTCCATIFKSTLGVFLFVVALIFFGWLALRLIGAFIVVSDPLHETGAIVVLSGGEPDRLVEAARLYSEGYSRKLIVTQTNMDAIDPESQKAIWKIQRAVELGIPKEEVLITQEIVNSTYGEAVQVLYLMQHYGISSCIVVTDPYHSRRTKAIFNDVFNGSGLSVSIWSVPDHWYTAATWFESGAGWRITFSEVFKLIGFWLGVRGN